ncbi:hypothetical protein DUNSADRAFT_422 [Dunaliella salina]|uniref:Uncharacterized protein n=1 Tax=Dunaliella salina TaxID=3046 RepID=A0ABQ7FZ00_DUNSA|nr:hypothetical protein DUNSADRAFT_422 [Dunaliella salina]|eukprot:KAF5827570.1 hypothetical protein DUNSADRAFT_422 [Dunaliella salina]
MVVDLCHLEADPLVSLALTRMWDSHEFSKMGGLCIFLFTLQKEFNHSISSRHLFALLFGLSLIFVRKEHFICLAGNVILLLGLLCLPSK